MSKSIEAINRLRDRLKAAILMRISYQLENKSLIPEKGIQLFDPRAERDELFLATVKVLKVGASGKCQVELHHGETVTYDVEEFSIDDLYHLLTLLENGE
ncbi:MAG: hypothetical protein AAF391_07155 [Bacteroidota bacterium]